MNLRRRGVRLFLLAVIAIIGGLAVLGHGSSQSPRSRQPDLAQLVAASSALGFARADAPRIFRFPADYGPHLAYRTEWWYFTGNLHTAGGRRFGYELSLFRIALSPKAPSRRSHWASNQIYMAHFAYTDVQGKRFRYFQRFERAAIGLAGAKAKPFRVWVDNWGVETLHGDKPPWRLHASADGANLELDLTPLSAPILQGDRGLSRKSAAAGNASYYYSLPRLATRGTFTLNGQTFSVDGLSWMDREWSTSALATNEVGWDWFGLQLSDGSDLMFYRLRHNDGSIDPFSQGSLVDAQGHIERLSAKDVRVTVLSHWRSPHGGIYPAGWRLVIARLHLALTVTPVLSDQELDVAVRYWEGAVNVRGRRGDAPISGTGYVELTGYARKKHTTSAQVGRAPLQ